MSLNQISQANPNIQPFGTIDGQFRSLKALNLEIEDITVDNLTVDALTTNTLAVLGSVTAPLQVDGSVTAQAVVTDQLAVANTIFPIVTAGERNLILESNDLQELVYTKYNFLGVNAPTTVSLVNNVSTQVIGPTSTDFSGSWFINNIQNLQTYKLTAECLFISPNAGNVIFQPKIGNVVLTNVTQALPVNNLTQEMSFEMTFSILSGAGTASTQITHSSKMQYRNAGTPTLQQIGQSASGPISTVSSADTVPSINLQYSTTGLDITVNSFCLNRLY
jgi:hypothetical protein